MSEMIPTPTVGEILQEEFLTPLGISAYRLAKEIYVPVSRVQEILQGRRRISADTSLRLSRYFGVSEQFFLHLQDDIDLRNQRVALAKELEKIRMVSAVPALS